MLRVVAASSSSSAPTNSRFGSTSTASAHRCGSGVSGPRRFASMSPTSGAT
jgi:hypothetical protein